jgi:hypothetical protein
MIPAPRPILAFTLFAAVLAAACSGGGAAPSGVATLDDPASSAAPGASGSAAPSISPEDAMLAFAKCMREHGVDMPDPVIEANGGMSVTVGAAGKPMDVKVMEAANEACKDLMPPPPDGASMQMTPEQQDAMLAFAKCMREHGVDMPDPEFGTGGGPVIINGQGGDGIAFDSPTFKAADEACRSIMTDALPGLVTGGSTNESGSGGGATDKGPSLHIEPAQ